MVIRESPFTARFDERVRSELRKWEVPGLTVAIVHGSSIFTKAYGISEFPDKPVTTNSLFSTCSTTKAFTAAVASLIIEDSKSSDRPVDWDTPLTSLIRDDFVLADEQATLQTTLEDALSHRSGLGMNWGAMRWAHKDENVTRSQQYTGRDLGSLLKDRIWKPLGMRDTYFSVHEAQACPSASSRLVRGYTWDADAHTQIPEPYMDYAPTTGCGAMVSSVEDYALWVRALIQSKMTTRDALLFPRITLPAFEEGVHPPAPYHLYALGWFVESYRGEPLYWHTGSWPGCGILVGFIPGKEFGFIMMGNAMDARFAAASLYMYLLDMMLGIPPDQAGEYSRQIEQLVRERRKRSIKTMKEAKRRLYPSLPSQPLPPSLSLELYAGVYAHPGYGSFELLLDEDRKLYADLPDRAIVTRLELEHASGDFFVGKLYSPGGGGDGVTFFQVEFSIDSRAQVERVGLDLEPELRGDKIWFDRA
ncbi:uncharacterized protein CDV56_105763 [Aspergillus thermomutatus]|uniref:Beta-lactamase-related domain-containing protein n=1 Tax=Aspergillus thermomutatus TaxID=41047 RepID=A0A397GQ31_ASPTH|nr:uncharacterized protein CDV56_105763 [Aspergillus thermomutatus]RHZ52915.1 hypothetical protein CDV56_105763 [Aspergillus thermomutatus]